MQWNDFKGLKWYLLFAAIVISFHAYSLAIGWKWINTTHKETTHNGTGQHGYRFYHK
ncbi:MAG: hypothetical protein HOP30_16270 [Cyclobacteriaceae bacterium]|nr:hypothetical protein [Cyclobacteriaceae bacterium]